MVANGRLANAVQIQQRIAKDFNVARIDWDAVPTDQDISEFCQHGFLVVQLEETCINLIYASAANSKKADRPYSTTMLEAIELCESISGRRLNHAYEEANRMGDHIWWISDNARFEAHYPDWSLQYDIPGILEEIFSANQQRWREAS